MKRYKKITLLLSLFLLGICINGQNLKPYQLKLYKNPPKNGLMKTNTFGEQNIDLDHSGAISVSGNYTSNSTSGSILRGFYAENKVEGDTLTVTLFPVFQSIGKDPFSRRVFAFQGYIENSYKYKKITLKLFDTETTLTN